MHIPDYVADSQVTFTTVGDIAFTNPMKELHKNIANPSKQGSKEMDSTSHLAPVQSEIDQFYAILHIANPKAAILSMVPGYPDAFMSSLPPTMSHYVKPEYMNLELTDLLKECERVFVSLFISSEQAKCLQEATKQQSRSRLWFQHKAGRITAVKK